MQLHWLVEQLEMGSKYIHYHIIRWFNLYKNIYTISQLTIKIFRMFIEASSISSTGGPVVSGEFTTVISGEINVPEHRNT